MSPDLVAFLADVSDVEPPIHEALKRLADGLSLLEMRNLVSFSRGRGEPPSLLVHDRVGGATIVWVNHLGQVNLWVDAGVEDVDRMRREGGVVLEGVVEGTLEHIEAVALKRLAGLAGGQPQAGDEEFEDEGDPPPGLMSTRDALRSVGLDFEVHASREALRDWGGKHGVARSGTHVRAAYYFTPHEATEFAEFHITRGGNVVRNHTGKYRALFLWLRRQEANKVAATFAQIEALGAKLPPSSRRYPAHWSGYESSAVVRAIVDAGFKATKVDLRNETVEFVRQE